ncbi:MAG: modulated efflux pump with fused ATPase and integral rane subunit [Chthonomonadaceae bacterium]|nr:modulated efflux pump with fused ATPase and integral rane subunit [Chthonomonadaceae bacterium]
MSSLPEKQGRQSSADDFGVLILLVEGADRRRYVVPPEGLVIGRDPEAALSFDDPQISWRHAEIRVHGDGHAVIDLGSRNGTLLNAEALEPHSPRSLRCNDLLVVGGRRLQVGREETSLAAVDARRQAGGSTIMLPLHREITIGRSPDSEVVLADPGVSWQHARFSRVKDGWEVEDLSSTNGTWVNDRRIERAAFSSRDRLRIGLHQLRLSADMLECESEVGQVRLDASGLSRVVWQAGKPITLLQDVSVSIRPRELVAIVGASGAGKSTLLLALNGYCPADRGKVLLNGVDLYTHPDVFRTVIGYVPQADIVHGELTVGSALRYAARLRLPGDTSETEIGAMIARVLAELDLTHRRGNLIRTLSGGERKRVNIAVELLTRPSLLFLDEPTTGLDPGLERRVTRELRELAEDGRTVIVVTHSVQTLDEYDRVLWMARGGLMAYCGPPREAPAHFGVADYAAVYDLLNSLAAEGGAIEALRFQAPPSPAPSAVEKTSSAHSGHRTTGQFRALAARYLEVIRADTRNLGIWLAEAPIVALIVACIFPSNVFGTGQSPDSHGNLPIQDAPRLLFLVALSITFFGLCNACREIVKEKAIYHRERHVALKPGSYLLSKVAVLGGVSLAQCILVLFMVQCRVDFGADPAQWGTILLLLFLGGLNAVLIGLWISAQASSPDQAITAVALVLLLQVVFSGLIPLEHMNGLFAAFAALTSTRWTYGGLCGGMSVADRWSDSGLGSQVQDVFHTSTVTAVAVLSLMCVFWGIVLYRTMLSRDRSRN